MSQKTRACPFTGCGEKLHPVIIACRKHWGWFNPIQRAELWKDLRQWQRGQIDDRTLLARQQAIVDQAEAAGRDAPDPAA